MFGVVKTSLPGVTFGSHFPKLAERAQRLAVVRSFQTPCKDHQDNWVRTMLTGSEEKLPPPSVGSVYSFRHGTSHPKTGVPSYTLLDSGNNKEFLQEHSLRGNTAGDLPAVGDKRKSFGEIDPALEGVRDVDQSGPLTVITA